MEQYRYWYRQYFFKEGIGIDIAILFISIANIPVCDVAYGVTICGDFNMPQANWVNGYDLSSMSALEACLFSFVTDNGLQQLVHDNTRLNNTRPNNTRLNNTRLKNTFDLLLTSDPFAIADVTVAPSFRTSDHSSITWRA